MTYTRHIITGTALSIGLLLSSTALANAKIGVVGAADDTVIVTNTDGDTREVAPGDPIFANDRIKTDDSGKTQIVFKDRSTITVNANSELKIDKFIYDPAKSSGEMAMDNVKGAFRFIGGALSKKKPVNIKTPVATIGIRGGIADTHVKPGGGTDAVFLYGEEMSVTNNAGQTSATQNPGSGFSLADSTSSPAAMNPAQVSGLLDGFTTETSGGGGASVTPQPDDVSPNLNLNSDNQASSGGSTPPPSGNADAAQPTSSAGNSSGGTQTAGADGAGSDGSATSVVIVEDPDVSVMEAESAMGQSTEASQQLQQDFAGDANDNPGRLREKTSEESIARNLDESSGLEEALRRSIESDGEVDDNERAFLERLANKSDAQGRERSSLLRDVLGETPAANAGTPAAETPIAETPIAETPIAETPLTDTQIGQQIIDGLTGADGTSLGTPVDQDLKGQLSEFSEEDGTSQGFAAGFKMEYDGNSLVPILYSNDRETQRKVELNLTNDGNLTGHIELKDHEPDDGTFGDGTNSIRGEFDDGNNSVFVNDDLFGAQQSDSYNNGTAAGAAKAAQGYIVSGDSSSFSNNNIPSGYRCDDCEFTNWGVWSGNLGENTAVGEASGVDEMAAMIPFVVGDITDPSNLPTNVNASYQGEAYASYNAISANQIHNIAGSMDANVSLNGGSSTVDSLKLYFGTVEGAALDMQLQSATNILDDGADRNEFQGMLEGITNPGGLDGETNGSMFGPNAEEIGGNFIFERTNGTPIQGGGIYFGNQ